MRLPAFEDLSKEQDLIYNLDLDGNYLVSGPPGTGKSVMALYRAQVLTFDDREPALLMYNNVLQQYTAQAADSARSRRLRQRPSTAGSGASGASTSSSSHRPWRATPTPTTGPR